MFTRCLVWLARYQTLVHQYLEYLDTPSQTASGRLSHYLCLLACAAAPVAALREPRSTDTVS